MFISRLSLVFLLIIGGCKSGGGSGPTPPNVAVDKLEFEDNLEKLTTVTYMAELKPVNTAVAGEAYGSFTFHKDHDLIVADIRLNDSAPIATQIQKVHLGNACPTEADDTNNDGYIDVLESGQVTGQVIIPLDGDLSSQYGLLGKYPITDAWGSYVYSQTSSFSLFYKDLLEPDINPEDEVVKINSPLGLTGKTVVIYGMEEDVEMPETVATNNDLTPKQTLPIACGVITLVTDVPGTFEPDDITVGHVPAPQVQPRRPSRAGSLPGSRPGSHPENPRRPGSPNDGSECSGTLGKACL